MVMDKKQMFDQVALWVNFTHSKRYIKKKIKYNHTLKGEFGRAGYDYIDFNNITYIGSILTYSAIIDRIKAMRSLCGLDEEFSYELAFDEVINSDRVKRYLLNTEQDSLPYGRFKMLIKFIYKSLPNGEPTFEIEIVQIHKIGL